MEKTADVHFIFEEKDGNVKIAAHKDVLAASSPVFDTMFNVELREEGDVMTVDSSREAFEEFLQFFYRQQVKLTIDNIAQVLKLLDKYGVTDCLPICNAFLQEQLMIDDIIWGLHLAIKFQLNDLMEFCSNKIRKNFDKVWTMFNVEADDKVKLLVNPCKRFVSDEDVDVVYQHILRLWSEELSEPDQLQQQSDEIDEIKLTLWEICDQVQNSVERSKLTDPDEDE